MTRTEYKNQHIREHYTIILKECYINNATGSRNIYADKMQGIKRIITKSHKELTGIYA